MILTDFFIRVHHITPPARDSTSVACSGFSPYTRIIRLTLRKHKWILNPTLEQSINVNSYKVKVPEPFNVRYLYFGDNRSYMKQLLMASAGGFISH
jgi:hypothetical protein